jgi:ATP-dependent Lon protease
VIKKLDLLDRIGDEGGENHKLRSWVDGFPSGSVWEFMCRSPSSSTMDPNPARTSSRTTRKTLDGAVYGMNGAKTQIMQILAQWISNPSVGRQCDRPARSHGCRQDQRSPSNGVAKVLRVARSSSSRLGGASDSANFVGHAFTYEGSTWGRIADSLMTARCMNPVLYFDELDKVSTTPHGEEIISMLIHLTDRSQNTQFHDRYFAGVDFDLSQCLFVFSYNDESKIHPVLKDRMQVIQCSRLHGRGEEAPSSRSMCAPQMHRAHRSITDVTLSDDASQVRSSREYSKEEEGVRTLMRALECLVTRINLLRIADDGDSEVLSLLHARSRCPVRSTWRPSSISWRTCPHRSTRAGATSTCESAQIHNTRPHSHQTIPHFHRSHPDMQ